MNNIYLPPHVQAAENKRFAADIFRNVTVEDPVARDFTSKLKRIHPDLVMVRAHNTVDADLPLRPGFYHVLQINRADVAPLSVFIVHDGQHNYCEPTSAVFERLAEGNLSQRRVRDRLAEQDRSAREAIDKENRSLNETRREELKERVNSAVRAQVSMDRSVPWTQSSQGRRWTS